MDPGKDFRSMGTITLSTVMTSSDDDDEEEEEEDRRNRNIEDERRNRNIEEERRNRNVEIVYDVDDESTPGNLFVKLSKWF